MHRTGWVKTSQMSILLELNYKVLFIFFLKILGFSEYNASLNNFQPMFQLWINQAVGFYSQNIWKTPVEE